MARLAESGSWALILSLGLLALARPGCGGGGDPPVIDETLAAALADVGPLVVEPALAEAGVAAEALVVAVAAWAQSPLDAEVQAGAQDAWRATMTAWQRVEAMQIGPLASSLGGEGGQDLRDEVYSWPTVNRCAVDQQTVAEEYAAPDFLATHLVNVYGLDALETLLFSPTGENGCAAEVDINAGGTWAVLGPDALQQRRADYANVVAAGVAARIAEARASWTSYEPQSLDALFEALYYLETDVKDDKLGGPIGRYDCGATSCLSFVETPLAGGSNEWIAQNLVGFRALFTGAEGTGIDDLLIAADRADVSADVLAALDVADAAAAALTVSVEVAAIFDPTAALALHDALTAVGDLLEQDVAPALVLQIPAEAAGDND